MFYPLWSSLSNASLKAPVQNASLQNPSWQICIPIKVPAMRQRIIAVRRHLLKSRWHAEKASMWSKSVLSSLLGRARSSLLVWIKKPQNLLASIFIPRTVYSQLSTAHKQNDGFCAGLQAGRSKFIYPSLNRTLWAAWRTKKDAATLRDAIKRLGFVVLSDYSVGLYSASNVLCYNITLGGASWYLPNTRLKGAN